MKHKIIFSLVLIIQALFIQAQSHSKLTIFNEEGNEFMLTLNGKIINETHQNRVEIDELTQTQYSAVINFKNKSLGIVKKTVFLEFGNHHVYRVFTNKRGKQVLRLFSSSPLTDFVEEPAPKPTRRDRTQPQKQQVDTPPETTEDQTTIRDPENVPQKRDAQSTDVTMTMPDGSKFEMSVKTNDQVSREESHQRKHRRNSNPNEDRKRTQPEPEEESIIYVEGYTGRIGCPHPISRQEVSNIVKTVENQTFSDTKMRTAKRALNNKCITVNDIGKIMNLFTFEDSKIEFAKHAYTYTHDVDNYYLLYNSFTFESSIEEIEKHIDQ